MGAQERRRRKAGPAADVLSRLIDEATSDLADATGRCVCCGLPFDFEDLCEFIRAAEPCKDPECRHVCRTCHLLCNHRGKWKNEPSRPPACIWERNAQRAMKGGQR
jgi:hypothetical protein